MNNEDVKRAYDYDLKKYGYVRQSTINSIPQEQESKKTVKKDYHRKSYYSKRIHKDIEECGFIRNDTINIIIGYIPPKPKKERKKKIICHTQKKKTGCKDSYIYHKIFDDYYGTVNNCMICGSTKGLQIHHKDKNHKNNDISNLIKLCYRCHCMLHKGDRVYRLMIKKL